MSLFPFNNFLLQHYELKFDINREITEFTTKTVPNEIHLHHLGGDEDGEAVGC
jgi:predicted DNA-binding protein with PD1-like motif